MVVEQSIFQQRDVDMENINQQGSLTKAMAEFSVALISSCKAEGTIYIAKDCYGHQSTDKGLMRWRAGFGTQEPHPVGTCIQVVYTQRHS